MLPPVGQGCWDEIYSSTSEPEPTAATSLTLIRECIYGCGWLDAHFCTPDSLFFLWLCAGGQEAGMAPTFTYTFSYLLQLFWCLSSNDFQGPANMNMYGNDPLAFSMVLIALQWQAKGEEAAAAASKVSWESNWRQQQSRLCMIDAAS